MFYVSERERMKERKREREKYWAGRLGHTQYYTVLFTGYSWLCVQGLLLMVTEDHVKQSF